MSLQPYTNTFISMFTETCTNVGQLRLVGGTLASEGRIEICLGGSWGTICDDFWDANEAQVACRQLGYSPSGKHTQFHLLEHHCHCVMSIKQVPLLDPMLSMDKELELSSWMTSCVVVMKVLFWLVLQQQRITVGTVRMLACPAQVSPVLAECLHK